MRFIVPSFNIESKYFNKIQLNSMIRIFGKSILQVPDTGTRVLDNTRPFLRSSIVSF